MRAHVLQIALVCSFAASSCTQLTGDVPSVDDTVIVAKVNECNTPGDGPKPANDYMQVGFANIYAACEAFFVSATRFQQNALATSNTLDAGLAGATSIINVTNSTAAALKAITITTAGVTFGKAILNDYVTVYTFGTHLYKVRQLVQNDMDNYVGQVAAPPDTCIAYANVQKLATRCTLANMQALLDAQVAIPSQAVSNGPNVAHVVRGAAMGVAPGAAPQILRAVPATPVPSVSSTVVPLHY
jgi:hypothetical protein